MKTTLFAILLAASAAHALDFPIDSLIAIPGKTTIGVKAPFAFTRQNTPTAPGTGGILWVNSLDQLKFTNSGGTITLGAAATSGTGTTTAILSGDGAGGFAPVTIGSALQFTSGTLNVKSGGVENDMLLGPLLIISGTEIAPGAEVDFLPTLAGNNTFAGDNVFGTVASPFVTVTNQLVVANQGLLLEEPGASPSRLRITTDSNITTTRTLKLNPGDANRTITISGDATISGTNTGDQTTITGNAGTATALQTARTINGASFDGSANIADFAPDSGSNDTYVASIAPTPGAYVTGKLYWFKANTANTGAATINFNSLGAKTIKKAAGGVTTDLADNDIRAGQWVLLVYDGTNMQMQSLLGNAGGGGGGGTPGGASGSIQVNDGMGGFAGATDFGYDGTFFVAGAFNSLNHYFVNGTQVVTGQQAGIGDAAGDSAGIGSDPVDLATLNAALDSHKNTINAILAALRAHGLIAP